MMMEEKSDSGVKQGVLSLNGLVYQLQPDMSVAVSRALTHQYPQQQIHSPRDNDLCIEHWQQLY